MSRSYSRQVTIVQCSELRLGRHSNILVAPTVVVAPTVTAVLVTLGAVTVKGTALPLVGVDNPFAPAFMFPVPAVAVGVTERPETVALAVLLLVRVGEVHGPVDESL